MANTKYDMSQIDAMEGHQFEHFIAGLLRKLNYQKVEVTRGSGDQGVDVLAEKEGVRYAIQCKCYTSDLGNTPVQEVNTGKMIYHCHVGVVVTNQYFTQSAREAAMATGVLLWDRSKLEKLIAQTQAESNEGPMTQQKIDSLSLWSGSPLLRRGRIALKDKEWKKASQFFDRVLNSDPENAEAYLGLVMAEMELSDEDEFTQAYIDNPRLMDKNNFNHAKEFAGTELSTWFAELEKSHKAKEQQREEKRRKALAPVLLRALEPNKNSASLIFAPDERTIGLKSDGTVVAVGNNKYGQCNVSDWTDIVAVSAGWDFTVGLKMNGTVVAVGNNEYGQYNVSGWTDIVAIAVGGRHTVGLRSDGTVVAAGDNKYGQCNVSDWTDIVAVSAGWDFTVGLKMNGAVVAVGDNDHGQCNVSDWTDVVAIAFYNGPIAAEGLIGLKSDGTVVTCGNGDWDDNWYDDGDWWADDLWKDVVDILSTDGCNAGLKSNGIVVVENKCKDIHYDVSNWTDIVAIVASSWHLVGLKSDGTVVATGSNKYGECDVQDWKLFNSLDTLEQERAEAKANREAERSRKEAEAARKKVVLESEKTTLQAELANLNGLFTGKRRKKIEEKLIEIKTELENFKES